MTAAPSRTALRARVALASVVAVVVALGSAGCSGSDEGTPPAAPTASTATAAAPAPASLAHDTRLARAGLADTPQDGLLLGSPRAAVTIIEYGDLTCRRCVAVHRTLVPALVARYVRPGVASLELRPLAHDARSRSLARSVFAAARQRRGWELVRLAALRSVPGATGATPTEPDARLAAALGLDMRSWRRDRLRPRWDRELLADANVAAVGRFGGFPVFLVRGRDAADRAFAVVTQPTSLAELARAIEDARG